jgi:hypothetical protein
MTQVHAVKGADADHAALRAQGPAFDVAEQSVHTIQVCGPALNGQPLDGNDGKV